MSLLDSARIRLKSALALAVALGLTACSQVGSRMERQSGMLPTCPAIAGSTMPPMGRDYTAVVPASFGWLPLALMGPGSVELVQGPSNGGSYPGYAAGASKDQADGAGPGFSVSVRPGTAGVTGQRLPGRACQPGPDVMTPNGAPTVSAVMPDATKKPAPPVHGSPAYFMAEAAYGNDGPGEGLTWKASTGNWLTVSLKEPGGTAVGWDSSTAEEALEHMARTLRVGAVPLPLPARFTGVPAAWRMRIGQITLTEDVSVRPPIFRRLDVTLDFGRGFHVHDVGPVFHAQAQLTVLPANPLSHGVLPIPTPAVVCKNGPGLTACINVSADTPELERFVTVRSPARSLLSHLTLLGADPLAWSPNLVAGTVQGGHRSSPGTPPGPVTSSNAPAAPRPEPVDLADPVVTHGLHVALRWVPQGGGTGSGVLGYEIYRTGLAPSAARALIATVGPNQDSYVDTTRLKVTSTGRGQYLYEVVVVTEDGGSVTSNPAIVELRRPAHA